MYDALPGPPGPRPLPPGVFNPPRAPPSGASPPPIGWTARTPIVLATFGRRDRGPRYSWATLLSLVLHVSLIGLTIWLSQVVVLPKQEPVTVVFHRPPPPPPPPEPEKPQPRKGGGRGVALPAAVSPEIQPELELSLASTADPSDTGPTGNWVGGSGPAGSGGPGWSDGLESGTVIKRSLARDPMEVNSAWECDFPESVKEGKVSVRIRVHVSAAGIPMRVTIVRPGPQPFNESALECAQRQRFHPALDVNGKPREGDREVGILFYRMGSGEVFGATTRAPATGPASPDKLDDPRSSPAVPPSPSG